MELILSKKPRNAVIISGFPSFGLVGTITTEFLISHLKCEKIGKIKTDDAITPVAAIHDNTVLEPFGIFYNQKYNLIILHAINRTAGFEWKLAKVIHGIYKETKAKEIISIEGVGAEKVTDEPRAFYFTNNKRSEKILENAKIEALNDGVVIGVTGALLLEDSKVPLTCIFAEAHNQMPDSKAAAKVIEVLDKYLNLKIDYEPLIEQAQKFEEKIKGMLSKNQEASELRDKKQFNYVG